MKTHDLIERLATRSPALPGNPLRSGLLVGLLLAIAASLSLMMVIYGHPALAALASASPTWWFALLSCLAILAAGTFALLRAARPGPFPVARTLLPLGILLILLLGTVVTYSVFEPVRSVGTAGTAGWTQCLMCIPLFALPAMLILFVSMRTAAPSAPRGTGALVGLIAGASGAVAFSCCSLTGITALMTLWYGLAIILCAVAGALAGGRFFRW